MSRTIDLTSPLATDDAKQTSNLLAMTGEGEIKGYITGSATVDVSSLVDGAGESVDITVAGVALGDLT